MPEIPLRGCTPEPLMNYLKALGVLRLASEQADCQARGSWRDNVFVLSSQIDQDALVNFFLKSYRPTPIIGPWAGGSGFFSKDNKKAANQLADSTGTRCKLYREAIASARLLLDRDNIKEKPTAEQKNELLRQFRAQLPEAAVQWMDAALILQAEGPDFAALLGTGGNDGRLDFSRNFMERLVQLGLHQATPASGSQAWLENALLGIVTQGLTRAAVGQFAPGRAGGPNATQAMEGDAADNPWDFVLAIEGALILGGAASRRFAVGADARAAFPFTVRPASVGYPSESDGDLGSGRGELWLPIWQRLAALTELRVLFGEGRAEVARRPARDGVDFARAVASLGVDRGIGQFVRLSFLKRSGKAYLATPVGRFVVRQQRPVDLLRQLDRWLDRFRFVCADDKAPPRFRAALRGIEQAIFDFCKYGGPTCFQAILVALGRAERELAVAEGWLAWTTPKKRLDPLGNLSGDWIAAANDGTAEFEIALALAGIFDPEGKIGPLRSNLEPVDVRPGKNGKVTVRWAEKDRAVVWNSASLPINLAQCLSRRMMDGHRKGCDNLPLSAANFVALDTTSRFLAGEIDDRRMEDLLWGLVRVQQKAYHMQHNSAEIDTPLPRVYALLKLLFLPEPLRLDDLEFRVKAQPEIVTLLTSGHVGQACRVAARRLRASGLAPLPHPRSGGKVRDDAWLELDHMRVTGARLAAALLFPVSPASVSNLLRLVARPSETQDQMP